MENFTTNPPEIVGNLLQFSWLDYSIFFSMFVVSALVGVYFGCFGTKQSTTSEYLLGSKAMGIFPIAMSLTASHLSGITLMGVPSEVYLYGTQFWACGFSAIIVSFIVVYIYLPVFYQLKVNTCYEYLKLRFDSRIQTVASFLYVILNLLHIPLIIYIPALAFNQVSSIELYKITPIICGICIFYTTIGGLKGVVWTDTIQFTITLGAMFTVFIIGIKSAGGVANIWNIAEQGERIEFFNLDTDPTVRSTFWGVTIGMSILWLNSLGINPSSVQRFMAMPSLKNAKLSMIIFGFGVVFTKSLSCYSGLIMYAKYHDCDPYSAGEIRRPDQLLPFYVLDITRHIPGLSGLFVSGIFSTALSTMSTHLNTLAGTIYEDFLHQYMPDKTTDKTANNIIKTIVVIAGIICVILVFLVERLGNVLQISNSLAGITAAPLLGLFTLGMLFPSVNTTGALYGSIVSLICTSWMVGGSQYYYMKGLIRYNYKPLSVENCNSTIRFINNSISTQSEFPTVQEPFIIYRLSTYWYPVISFIVAVLVGLLASRLSKKDNQHRYNKNLYSPIIHKWIEQDPKEYQAVKLNIAISDCNEEPSAMLQHK